MRTVIIGSDEALNHELTQALAQFPEIELAHRPVTYPEPDDLLRIIRTRRPDFLFLSIADFSKFESLAGVIDDAMPGLPVVGLGNPGNLVEIVPKMMHLGVRELLTPPITSEKLGQAIGAIAKQLSRHPAPTVRLGDIYAFFPAKPGVGASTLAVSASCAAAAELGARTLLLDCDLQAGATKFLLNLGESASIITALSDAERLDEDLWSQMVGKRNKLDVLHAGELDPPDTLSAEALERVLAMARTQYDTICADLASSLDPFTVGVLRESRQIFLVTTPELVPLHMAADRLRHLKELGFGDRVVLLLNRRNTMRRGLTDEEAAKLVGIPVAHRFPNDYSAVQQAVLDGGPISFRSGLGQAVLNLATSISSPTASHKAPSGEQRKFLEYFHLASPRDHDTQWRD